MGRGQYLRRLGLVLLLGLISIGSLLAANRADVDDVSIEAIVYDQTLTTPMLSARRIPKTIQAPVVDDRLSPSLAELIAGSTEATCVLVQVGGRTLEPTARLTDALVPASNQKLLTTFGALEALGPEFTYRTTVAADAEIVGGVVEGNLYLVGDGDPFLSTADWWTQYEESVGRFNTSLEELADRVASSGITTVTGNLIGDESLFDEIRQGPWAERLIASKQSGPLSALAVNEGFIDWPEVFTGTTRTRSETDNPPLHAVSVLNQLLAERGVVVAGTGVGIAPEGVVEVGAVTSPPLSDIITHVNSYSSNVGAELLLKRIGLATAGIGSTAVGAEALTDILAMAGIPLEGVRVADGSGLSENNRLSCEALGAILTTAGPESIFSRSLSIGASRGSLLNRFGETPAAGAVYAKTGTLNDASALSGYVRSANTDGVWLTFAYVANGELIIADEAVRALQEPFVVALTSYPGEPSVAVLSPRPPVAN